MELTTFDKDLLNLLQGSLPVCSRPFAALAEKLGTTEEAVIDRLQVLKEEGYLRRIGTFFNSGRLGYKGTLVALRVDPEKMEAVAKAINRYPGATHNYASTRSTRSSRRSAPCPASRACSTSNRRRSTRSTSSSSWPDETSNASKGDPANVRTSHKYR